MAPGVGLAGPQAAVVVLHPSDEMYGADKVVLEISASISRSLAPEVWLPLDVHYEERPLSRELTARGFDVARLPTPVLRRAKLNFKGLAGIARDSWRTYLLMRRRRPSIVYLNTTAMLPAVVPARLAGAKVIVHVHENLTGVERLVLCLLMIGAHRVITVSQAVQRELRGPARWRSTVIYNGFAIEEACDTVHTDDTINLLIASRWNEWKGHALFLEALATSGRRDIRVTVAGGPPTAGRGVDVQTLAKRFGVADQCRFIGEVADIRTELDRADFVVVPSTLPDPLPTIAIESLARSCPVLASDSGGLPEIVSDCVTGFLVETGSLSAWSVILRDLTPPEGSMRRACRTSFDSMFSPARFQDDVRQLVDSIQDPPGPEPA